MRLVFRFRLLAGRLSCSTDDLVASLVGCPNYFGCCVYSRDVDLAFSDVGRIEDDEIGEAV